MILLLGLLIGGLGMDEALAKGNLPQRIETFVATHEAKIRPLEKASSLAWWSANVSGNDADFKAKEEAQNQLDEALSDPKRFSELKGLKTEAETATLPPLAKRQLDVLYLQYLEKQVDPKLLKKMTAKANAVEKAFNTYRAKLDGKEISDSEVRKILKSEKSSEKRRAVWESSKGVGAVVAADLKELVKVRNEAARKLGFKNFHAMMLALAEQDGAQIMKLFDELDELTRAPFLKVKKEIDTKLAKDFGIKPEALRAWHYHDPFFQEAPSLYETDLDSVYAKQDILRLCRDYYAGIGLPIDDVIAKSDLYEKKGKSPHAFCTDIDREGDVRVLANIVPNNYWMGTMLHELGHAVYSSKNMARTIPYVLRSESHILTTEGIAMLFGRFSKKADWMKQMGIKLDQERRVAETGEKILRNELLIFSRWCQVMLRFEKALYENPDQDLNRLWWELVEKYQGIPRPENRNAADYASKIHIASAPVYYHNYMMGELFASQLHHTISKEVTKTEPGHTVYVGVPAVGEFLKRKVFDPAKTLPWNELTKFATGEELNAKAFAADFKG